MSTSFLSAAWYRVAHLKPQLHPHVRVHRQRLRGEPWYILRDRSAARVHRFTPAAYALISRMDGTRTVNDLWGEIAHALGDDAPSQDDVIRLLHQLHAADVLATGVPPDVEEMNERRRKQSRSVWLRNLMNPMAFRIPLWDPQRFLERTWPVVQRVIGPVAGVIWLTLVVWAGALAWMHWRELTENLADRVLAFQNLFLLWLTYPLVKFCHELGHAYAVRSGGGEVHEMGVMFLVFAPVPYVDASAAAGFRSKARRVLVGSAGMLVEILFAAIAMFVWIAAEPGVIRAVAFNVMLIGGFATVVFNGNPLLRFDGYYILSDLVEIPNLAQRSTRYWAYLAKRVFGAADSESPAHTRGERVWFAVYGPTSWIYRVVVMLAIAFFVMREYFFIGVVLGLWSLFSMLVLPSIKALGFVLTNAELDRHRWRANVTTFGTIAALVLALALIPLPSWTDAEAVVWVPDNAEARAGTAGFVERVLVAPGSEVTEGDALVELADVELLTEANARAARIDQLKVQLASEMFTDRLKAELTRQQLEAEQVTLERLENRLDALIVRAGRNGRWIVPNAADLPGKYFSQGALVGYVLSGTSRTLRVVVPQDDVDLVRGSTRAVRVKLPNNAGVTHDARIVREVPGGTDKLPSKTLSLEGGGPYGTDPRDQSGLKTLARTFQFDLELDRELTGLPFGMRAYVKFEHAYRPLGVQAYLRIRQVLLSQLNV